MTISILSSDSRYLAFTHCHAALAFMLVAYEAP